MDFSLEEKTWWPYLEKDIKELLLESVFLSQMIKSSNEQFHDYSFIVFPAAKAYEGFLKKVFLERGFISEADYFGKRFRIGKALNPSLEEKYRSESVYDKVVDFCRDRFLADKMWETWKNSRNLVFHWFPNEKNAISLEESQLRLKDIIETMEETYKGCKISRREIKLG